MVVIDMPRAPREKSESGIYHIMIRGANRQKIIDTIEKDQLGRIKSFPKLRESSVYPKGRWQGVWEYPPTKFLKPEKVRKGRIKRKQRTVPMLPASPCFPEKSFGILLHFFVLRDIINM